MLYPASTRHPPNVGPISAQWWQYQDRRKPEAGTMPYSYFEWLQGFFIVHSTVGSTVHSMPLNSLEHCICTTTMTNIRLDRDSNLVPPGYKPQSIRMSHRDQPLIRNIIHISLWILWSSNHHNDKLRGAYILSMITWHNPGQRRLFNIMISPYSCSDTNQIQCQWWVSD